MPKTETPKRVRIGMHGVGPAFDHLANSPAGRLDRKDAETEEHRKWTTLRGMVVTVGKRMGLLSETKKIHDAPLAAPSSSGDEDDATQIADAAGDTIEPPFDFSVLCALHESSSSLRQNVDAMATNIDGFGHRFVPVLDFDGPDIEEDIRDIMIRERLDALNPPIEDLMDLTAEVLTEITPSSEEVKARMDLWRRISILEKGRVESFFEFVNPLKSFVEVRTATREGREILGNAGWEVIREDPADVNSSIAQVYNVPFANIKLVRADKEPTTVKMRVRKDRVHFDTIEVDRFFRRFVRESGSQRTFYKEFGDPRVVSRSTGNYYKTVEELRSAEDKNALVANEFFHWDIPSQSYAYGVPRWIGALLSVMGSRAAEEVNFLYFDNKAIPAMILLVSGGRVSQDSINKLESYIEEQVKGRANYHKIMVIEGLPADADDGEIEHSGKMRLELKPLLGDQMQDALFQKYDEANIVKIGRSFRQPQILTGDTRDMNRSTAQVAKAFAEEQIYQPARDAFDACMDRHFMVNLKIHFWRFKTNAPVQRLPNDLVDNVKKSLDAGALTPNEARKLLEDAFSADLEHRSEDWGNIPPKLALLLAREASMSTGDEGPSAADQVESAAGDMLARGRTSEEEGHSHPFTILRGDAEIRAFVLPAGEDGHSHEAEVSGNPGDSVAVKTTEVNGHSHEIKFTIPMTKRRARAQSAAKAVAYLRMAIEEELEAAKDEFFDGSEIDDTPED